VRSRVLGARIIAISVKARDGLCQSSAPEINCGGGGQSSVQWAKKKPPYLLTSEMPHLRILPRSRLCQNLARRNALQFLGYVPVVHILAARRRRRRRC
jgi:hypothetical protein